MLAFDAQFRGPMLAGLVAAVLAAPGSVLAHVDLELRGLPAQACGSAQLNVGLFAVSDDGTDQAVGGLEVILSWDPAALRLIGKVDNGPYAWLGSFFPNDSQGDGLNAPFTGPAPFVPGNDGDAIYSAFAQLSPAPPAYATASGLLVTTFRFQAFATGAAQLVIAPILGGLSTTKVVDGFNAGLLVTGALGSAQTDVRCPAPVAAIAGARHIAVTPLMDCPSQAVQVVGSPVDPAVACVSGFALGNGVLDSTALFRPSVAWGTVVVHGLEIVPEAEYLVRVNCGSSVQDSWSAQVAVRTRDFADVDASGVVDLDDVLFVLDAFAGLFVQVTVEDTDILPCEPNFIVDLDDILAVLDAFAGVPATAFCSKPCPL